MTEYTSNPETKTDFQIPEAQLVDIKVGSVGVRGLIEREETKFTGTFISLSPTIITMHGEPEKKSVEADPDVNLVRKVIISGGRGYPVNATVTLGGNHKDKLFKVYEPITGTGGVEYETIGLELLSTTWRGLREEVAAFIDGIAQGLKQSGTFEGPTAFHLHIMASNIRSLPPQLPDYVRERTSKAKPEIPGLPKKQISK